MSTETCIVDVEDWQGADTCTIGDVGGGLLAEEIASTGDAGPGYAFGALSLPADNGKEICGRVTFVPAGLTLTTNEDTSGSASAVADGVYVAKWQLYANREPIGAEMDLEFIFGPVTTGVSYTEGGDTAGVLVNISAAPGTVGVTVGYTEQSDTVAALIGILAAPVTVGVSYTEESDTVAAVIAVAQNAEASVAYTEQSDTVQCSMLITAAAGTEPITLAQAKAHLRVVTSDEDEYIQGLIVAARQMIEERTQRALVPRTEVLALDTFPAAIRLPWPVLQAVTSIVYLDVDGAEQTLSAEDYRVNAHTEPARITRAAGVSWPATENEEAAVLVTYTTGYPDAAAVPGPLKQWMLLAIGALYENREQVAAGVPIVSIPDDFMGLLWQPYMVYL